VREPGTNRTLRFACAVLALTLGLADGASLADGSSLADDESRAKDQPTAHEIQLARVLFEQTRAYQLSRGTSASLVPPPLDSYGPRVRVEDGLTILARITGKQPAQPEPLPAETLLQQGIASAFKSLSLGGGCCPCATAPSCDDLLFCNGVEVCQSSICGAGSAPCVDGDRCTTDECFESTSTCIFNAIPPPAEVDQLDVARDTFGSPVATLTWSATAGADDYNVYRGEIADLRDLACLIPHVVDTRRDDDGKLPSGAFYYLVTAFACGESGLGSANPGGRPPPPGCP